MKYGNRLIIGVILTACSSLQGYAQGAGESFADFRKRIMSDFNDYRSSVFENYDKFLEGAWVEYDRMKAEKSNPNPKPREVPVAEMPEVKAPVTEIPVVKKPAPASKPTPKPTAKPVSAPKPTPKPVPTPPVVEKKEPVVEKPTPVVTTPVTDRFRIGMTEMSVPHIEYKIAQRLNTPQDFAAHWRGMAKSDLSQTLIPEIKKLGEQYGLNDYLLFEAVNAYVDSRFPNAHSSARKSLAHYILTGLGYDVRLGKTDSGNAFLLVPFKQMVYARTYLNFDGKKYFIFADEGVDLMSPENMKISSCKLPSDADAGEPLDLVVTELRLPYEPAEFSITNGDISITGEYNKAIIPLLHRYPQMPMGDYARSNVLPGVRESIVAQLKAQLGDMEQPEAVNKLLRFVQKGFEYAFDEENHGFEKPYFFEENLFYPKNDCEDRAIFYTYLLWEVLGVPNQLICYPGHESASVVLDTAPKGTRVSSYSQDGTTYYISDPTYIGSVTGMCMPAYEKEKPTIDFTYK